MSKVLLYFFKSENNISDLNPLSNFQYLLNLTSLEINLEYLISFS